jgi:hypothetical protein
MDKKIIIGYRIWKCGGSNGVSTGTIKAAKARGMSIKELQHCSSERELKIQPEERLSVRSHRITKKQDLNPAFSNHHNLFSQSFNFKSIFVYISFL